MSTYSVAEAKNRLPELITRALKGEQVIISRHGRPVAELRPTSAPTKKVTADDLDWLAARRVGLRPPQEDAGTFISRMRDESEH